MLKPYLDEVANRPDIRATGPIVGEHVVHALGRGIDFLSDPDRFLDPRTNIIVGSARRLIGSGAVGIAFVPGMELERVTLTVNSAPEEDTSRGLVLLPNDYCQATKKDPLQQLAEIVFASEGARVFTGNAHLLRSSDEDFDRIARVRTQVAEAEFLRATEAMAKAEGISHEPSAEQLATALAFPRGYEDLDPSLAMSGIPVPAVPELSPKQLEGIGLLDYAGLVEDGISTSAIIFHLMKTGHFEDLITIERTLRSVSSALFLQAVPPAHLGVRVARDVTGREQEFGLYLSRGGADPTNDPQRFLDRMGVSYEENLERLARTGFLSI